MKITQDMLCKMVLESAQASLDFCLYEKLADSVAIALIDKYGFDESGAYDIAFDTIDANTDRLTGNQQKDFDMMLNLALQDYVNEAVSKKRVIKEDVGDFTEYNPEPAKTRVSNNPTDSLDGCCSYIIHEIEETFKKDDIENVDGEVLKQLIVDIYDKLTQAMNY